MLFDLTANSNSRKIMVLDPNYPEDVAKTVIKGNTVNATFTAVISEPGKPDEYSYQWYVDDVPVTGATESSYTRAGLSSTATYKVYCIVSNKAGFVKSREATLEVIQHYTPVLDSGYPANQSVVIHNSITSEVRIATAGNPESYTYQWYQNGSAVSGATGASYTFTPGTKGSYTVYCEVTNEAGTVKSREATITATPYYIFRSGVGHSNSFIQSSVYTEYKSQITSEYIVCNAPGHQNSNGASGFSAPYDFTKYTKLVYDVLSNNSKFSCGYTNVAMDSYNPTLAGYQTPSTGTRQTVAVDISSVYGQKYITMKIADGAAGAAYVYNIYLE